MNPYNIVGLYDHNAEGYDKIKEGFITSDIISILHATGTGKTYIADQLCYDTPDKNVLWIVTSLSIAEHITETIEENPNLDFQRDFSHLTLRTYQSLINCSREELAALKVDILIIDEFYHLGAPIWSQRINTIIETHKFIKVLGISAYSIHGRNTPYERDLTNPDTNELFFNTVVSRYDLCDAIIDGVLPKPNYKSGYTYLENYANSIEQILAKTNPTSKEYQELSLLLKDIKRRLHQAKQLKDIFKTNIKSNGKYIYFCPLESTDGKNNINIHIIMEEVKGWIQEMGLTENDYEFYVSTSKMGKEGKENRQAFYHDKSLSGENVKQKLRIMFAINQYNEGSHVPGVDGVIMGRATKSDIVFFEQLGRALSVRGKTKEEYDILYKKPIEELIELCHQREITITDQNSKEEIIEQLLAPVIIDLAGNIEFIKELENNLTMRVKKIQQQNSDGTKRKRKIHIGNTKFNIQMINEDIFKDLEDMYNRLAMTWEDKYLLAKNYYEHHGNLSIPKNFKTINGYTFDVKGIRLGIWLINQKQIYRNGTLSEERIHLLQEIGIEFNVLEQNWQNNYTLVKNYYEHYGNLNIPQNFKTTNGYTFDENGVQLGHWLNHQKKSYRSGKLNEERIRLLQQIGMKFNSNKLEENWQNNYALAKNYYEHYGNLNIPQNFKTTNGYTFDENGVQLGHWLDNQKKSYRSEKISEERIHLLQQIGMKFNSNRHEEIWQNNYTLAKNYYEHHGNLNIPVNFKTTNGYIFDENGIQLGTWLQRQKKIYYGKRKSTQIEEKIKLLEDIGIQWFQIEKKDNKYQSEEITEKNNARKQIEFLNRVRSYLNNFDGNTLLTKEEINQGLLDELNHLTKKRKK